MSVPDDSATSLRPRLCPGKVVALFHYTPPGFPSIIRQTGNTPDNLQRAKSFNPSASCHGPGGTDNPNPFAASDALLNLSDETEKQGCFENGKMLFCHLLNTDIISSNEYALVMNIFILVGHNIQTERKKADLSQDELANRIGMGRSHLSNIENAKKNPSLGALFAILQGLKIPITKLFTGIPDE